MLPGLQLPAPTICHSVSTSCGSLAGGVGFALYHNSIGAAVDYLENNTCKIRVALLNGKKAAPGEVAIIITTNAQGVATTGPNVLPYGDYIIRQKSSNASMLKTFTEEIPVTVAENGKMYTFTAENDVVRGWESHTGR